MLLKSYELQCTSIFSTALTFGPGQLPHWLCWLSNVISLARQKEGNNAASRVLQPATCGVRHLVARFTVGCGLVCVAVASCQASPVAMFVA